MRLLQVVPSINPGTGGTAVSAPGLARALARHGMEVTLATLDYPEHGGVPALPGVRVIACAVSPAGRVLRGWSPALARSMRGEGGAVDLVHSHALWMRTGTYARRLAQHRGVPLVLSPRGMLDEWSLQHSAWRKKLALALYERRNLDCASLLHATSDAEAEAIRRFGCRQPIAVLPNGVEFDRRRGMHRSLLESGFPPLRHKRWLLFLGRLHPKKGLPMLLDAWAGVAADRPDWQLVIAGPDLTGHRAELDAKVRADARLQGRVTFTGMLEGERKAAALAGAQLSVLPTFSENFGMAVAEALAAGVPVITTTRAPWHALAERDCGWWVEPRPDELQRALAAATALPPAELAAMGERGRALAREFGWDAVAARMIEVYAWLRGRGPRPACVVEP